MLDIILTTLNARYSHTAFGLRYLWANLGPLQARAGIREFIIGQEPAEIAEALLLERPRLVGVGVYIWNIETISRLVQTLKGVSPETVLVLGGPEISHEFEETALYRMSDYLVLGEGEQTFRELAEAVLGGHPPRQKVLAGERPDLAALTLPYAAYTDHDIAHRTLYVETSRGCPFRCEFCLSSLEPCVREFPLSPFFDAMDALFARGARQFKFVDRTFNLREDRVLEILDFFRARLRDGIQVHFEIVPDRLSARTLERMAAFPPGVLRLEVGVQTFNRETQEAILRVQDLDATLDALHFLRERTGALLHADLVALFPELREVRISHSWCGFVAYTFDELMHIGRHEGMHYAMGYCGSGVGMGSYLGMRLGQQVLGLAEGRTAFDDIAFQTRPLYSGKPWFLAPSIRYNRWRDKQNR